MTNAARRRRSWSIWVEQTSFVEASLVGRTARGAGRAFEPAAAEHLDDAGVGLLDFARVGKVMLTRRHSAEASDCLDGWRLWGERLGGCIIRRHGRIPCFGRVWWCRG